MPKLNTRNCSLGAYTFLTVCEEIRQFQSSTKKTHPKENWFLFFCLTMYH